MQLAVAEGGRVPKWLPGNHSSTRPTGNPAATRSRCGSTPRIRPTTTAAGRRAHPLRDPDARGHPGRRGLRDRLDGVHALRRRCWPRWSLTHRRARLRSGSLPHARAGADPWCRHQPRPPGRGPPVRGVPGGGGPYLPPRGFETVSARPLQPARGAAVAAALALASLQDWNARCSKGSLSGGATWSASRTARPSTAT